jgi:hypothetical protein
MCLSIDCFRYLISLKYLSYIVEIWCFLILKYCGNPHFLLRLSAFLLGLFSSFLPRLFMQNISGYWLGTC